MCVYLSSIIKGVEAPAELGLTERLSLTDENCFDLATVGRVLNLWANLADKIHNSRPRQKLH